VKMNVQKKGRQSPTPIKKENSRPAQPKKKRERKKERLMTPPNGLEEQMSRGGKHLDRILEGCVRRKTGRTDPRDLLLSRGDTSRATRLRRFRGTTRRYLMRRGKSVGAKDRKRGQGKKVLGALSRAHVRGRNLKSLGGRGVLQKKGKRHHTAGTNGRKQPGKTVDSLRVFRPVP